MLRVLESHITKASSSGMGKMTNCCIWKSFLYQQQMIAKGDLEETGA